MEATVSRLLVVDDEPNVLFSLQESLKSDTLEVFTARTAKEGIEHVQRQKPDAVILDVRLPDMSGLDAFDRIRQIDARLPVIIITAFAATETAIQAMKRGAFEYLLKPLDLGTLRTVLAKALEQNRLTHVRALLADEEEPDDVAVDRIIGRSPAMQEVYKEIGRAASQDVTVLILGESGTGKELVARAIYQHGLRSERPFLAINCAAIPETLLEAELFGHERGAFTGADRRRIGKFEQADGGTIFLDEIGDMSPATQAKMLRILQDGRFERLGSSNTIQANVRLIAATNRDLVSMIADERFRQDLFYRLNVFTIALPPLRERRVDIPSMAEHLVKLFNRELGKQVRTISPETMRLLESKEWPGNVRELQATIKYAMVHATGDILTPDCLPAAHRVNTAATVAFSGTETESEAESETGTETEADTDSHDIAQLVRDLIQSGNNEIYQKVISMVDRVVLKEVLNYVRGNQFRASELLGISRNTLRSKIRAAKLAIEKQVWSESDHSGQ
ncbi:sigma-54 dependent transcriptional regulator [Singulisphaera sp. Ch08]|uniref:DNA-binding transcriptional regulator NtrC n=1 Tax=Singulisphaera sp. Ch08 TaxID=3120278 RepID=A0AAU7CI06_9BACT